MTSPSLDHFYNYQYKDFVKLWNHYCGIYLMQCWEAKQFFKKCALVNLYVFKSVLQNSLDDVGKCETDHAMMIRILIIFVSTVIHTKKKNWIFSQISQQQKKSTEACTTAFSIARPLGAKYGLKWVNILLYITIYMLYDLKLPLNYWSFSYDLNDPKKNLWIRFFKVLIFSKRYCIHVYLQILTLAFLKISFTKLTCDL